MFGSLARLITGATLVLALVGCPTSTGARVLSVAIVGGDRVIAEGSAGTLPAEVESVGGAGATLRWDSSDQIVATVDAGGTVAALAPGAATITATSTHDPSKRDAIVVTVAPPGSLAWTRQFGTSTQDPTKAVTTDSAGYVYAVGLTDGSLGGDHAGNGSYDGYIRSYASNGDIRWTRQFGSTFSAPAVGVATDATDNVYAAGHTSGALGGDSAGSWDAYIRSYDSDGNHRWTRQFGTSSRDEATGIATDASGNVYVSGWSLGALEGTNAGVADAFIRSYDSSGNHRWTRQFGTANDDYVESLATDANANVYAVGYTFGDLAGDGAGSDDAFILSFDSNGNHRWTRQFGTSDSDQARDVTVDLSGNVYVTGFTLGVLEGESSGGVDTFIRSYDGDGNHRWTRQFGTSGSDLGYAITSNWSNEVYLAGTTTGILEGSTSGWFDGFIRSYDANGNERWTRQFGTDDLDEALGIAADVSGSIYVSGYTHGDLEGENAGDSDGFIRKYGP